MKRVSTFNQAAYTVAEMIIAVGVLGLLGAVFFSVLQSGLILSAKNTAVNAAHEEARQGVVRLTRDIHASISVPQLRDTGFAVISPTPVPSSNPVAPTAAGVSFQNIASGPNYVWKDPGSATLIMIRDNPDKPVEGMRIVIPFWGIEDDIAKVTASGTASHSNVFTANAQEQNVNNAPTFGGTTYAIVYYTNRTMYLVRNGTYIADPTGPYTITTSPYTTGSIDRYVLQAGNYVPSATGGLTIKPATYVSGVAQRYRYENGELHFYQQRYAGSSFFWKDVAIVARYISSPEPFSVPLNRGGSSNN